MVEEANWASSKEPDENKYPRPVSGKNPIVILGQ